MGWLVDLSVEWDRYKAAREALAMDAMQLPHIKERIVFHRTTLGTVDKQLEHYLTEGVLTEAFVVDNIPAILDCLRVANTVSQHLSLMLLLCFLSSRVAVPTMDPVAPPRGAEEAARDPAGACHRL
jgi:hypothetical protein